MENLIGQMVHVVVSKGGKSATKFLKVCKVKARSVLFIEVIKPERKNIFRKASMKMLDSFNESTITFKDNTLLDKWESSWDAIGQLTPSYSRQVFSKHSKGWAPRLPSTTNSSAGFPMV